jgi:hypothetical protein
MKNPTRIQQARACLYRDPDVLFNDALDEIVRQETKPTQSQIEALLLSFELLVCQHALGEDTDAIQSLYNKVEAVFNRKPI